MTDQPGCSRCNGALEAGKMRHYLEFGSAGTLYWCPWDESTWTSSQVGRRELVFWRCQACGHVELFAGPPEMA